MKKSIYRYYAQKYNRHELHNIPRYHKLPKNSYTLAVNLLLYYTHNKLFTPFTSTFIKCDSQTNDTYNNNKFPSFFWSQEQHMSCFNTKEINNKSYITGPDVEKFSPSKFKFRPPHITGIASAKNDEKSHSSYISGFHCLYTGSDNQGPRKLPIFSSCPETNSRTVLIHYFDR